MSIINGFLFRGRKRKVMLTPVKLESGEDFVPQTDIYENVANMLRYWLSSTSCYQ